ncbi:MAG: hypothetical protein GKS05_08235 [Nitrospirales bacterium]|nr:hypothetical protein [Nitrospirales bacterium]
MAGFNILFRNLHGEQEKAESSQKTIQQDSVKRHDNSSQSSSSASKASFNPIRGLIAKIF